MRRSATARIAGRRFGAALVAAVLALAGLVALATGLLRGPSVVEAPMDTLAGELQTVTLRVEGMT
jgi:hypothetical protein